AWAAAASSLERSAVVSTGRWRRTLFEIFGASFAGGGGAEGLKGRFIAATASVSSSVWSTIGLILVRTAGAFTTGATGGWKTPEGARSAGLGYTGCCPVL